MFIELAFIDWIALAFAAILLAGAAAAAVLAYVTRQARTSEPKNGYAHASSAATTTSRGSKAGAAHATDSNQVIDLRDHKPIHAASSAPQHANDCGPVDSEVPEFAFASLGLADTAPSDDAPVASADTGLEGESKASLQVEELPAMPMPAVKDVVLPAAVETESDVTAQLASRAAKLRGRPVAEPIALGESTTPQILAKAAPRVVDGAPEVDPSVPSRLGFSARVPGFFEDPMGRHELRYWDGRSWTEYVKESGERFTDPL